MLGLSALRAPLYSPYGEAGSSSAGAPPARSATQVLPAREGAAYSMSDLLAYVKSAGGSDLHLRVGYPPLMRIHGSFKTVGDKLIDSEGMRDMIASICSADNVTKLDQTGSADYALVCNREGYPSSRFRVNIFKERGNSAVVLRNIPDEIISLDKLGVPRQAIERFISLQRGLVLVVGPTGSGKTTTLASIIDKINSDRSDRHILSIEAPIEFEHRRKRALVSQREVGIDVESFAAGIRDSLREDPNVILVGELRDLETMEAALEAAETGHLVFATLHTTGAAKTVDRIISAFPEKQQAMIRIQMATVLQGIVSQLLVPRIDEPGRIAVFEVMVMNPAIATNIRDNKPQLITNAIQTGAKEGMVTMDDALLQAFVERKIGTEDVYSRAFDLMTIKERMKRST